MLLGTLAASLWGNMLAGKGINRAGYVSKDLQSLYALNNNVTYFDSFGAEQKKFKNLLVIKR